jgi:hypothetical protein
MQAALAARLELEVLDRIGDVASRALEPSLLETDVEQASGRADKGVACNILLVAGCSPTSMISAFCDPSPKTSWVAFL